MGLSLLYSNVNSAVLVNGFLTEYFPISRGVRQGCPLSPLLYVLVAETLACAIRADASIDGFPLPGSTSTAKISQYALRFSFLLMPLWFRFFDCFPDMSELQVRN